MSATQEEAKIIPVATIAHIMKKSIKDPEMKISKAAVHASAHLMTIFAQEAFSRAVAKAREDRGEETTLHLDVDDLEKIIGQMVVDF